MLKRNSPRCFIPLNNKVFDGEEVYVLYTLDSGQIRSVRDFGNCQQ
eukprot:UN02140